MSDEIAKPAKSAESIILQQCPRCGGLDIAIGVKGAGLGMCADFTIYCKKCNLRGRETSVMLEAIRSWNSLGHRKALG